MPTFAGRELEEKLLARRERSDLADRLPGVHGAKARALFEAGRLAETVEQLLRRHAAYRHAREIAEVLRVFLAFAAALVRLRMHDGAGKVFQIELMVDQFLGQQVEQ